MKLGVIRVPSGIEAADPGVAAELGRIVEASGCESLWTVEHVVVPDRYDSVYPFHPSGKMRLDAADEIPDPMTWMTWLSARTTTLRLGVGVLILPLRNPVVLAKQLATMDRLSGGRIILGAGLGWMSEEYDAIGVPFERRGHRADEYLGAMRALWSTSPASFHGDTVDFTDIHCHPQPRSGRVPIVIGGISRAAVRRAVRFGDGMHLLRTPLEEVHEVTEMLAEECARVDRDPGEIELTMIAPRSGDELSAMAELGVGRVILSLWEGD
ncbi:MAG: putative oxidoreductase, partial [Nocardioidaceae bacterium]|nr:putative oxidoreductase [Nocardioidaceae bacterium]